MKTLGATSSGLLKSRRLKRILALLGWRLAYAPLALRLDAVAGWGEKEPSRKAKALASNRKLPFLTLEDGFVRSNGLGVEGAEPLSIVMDRRGAYFNSAIPSDLYQLLNSEACDEPGLLRRASESLDRLIQRRITKYNIPWAPMSEDAPAEYVLVIDQTFGDAAILGARANAESFARMLEAAMAEANGLPVLVKTHPDVLCGKRRGYLDPRARYAREIVFVSEPINPWALIARARRVYAVSSLMGYEAALAGVETHIFGWPFYAGWGVTCDRGPEPAPLPRRSRSREALFAGTHLLYPIYFDPVADALCDFETVLDRLSAPG